MGGRHSYAEREKPAATEWSALVAGISIGVNAVLLLAAYWIIKMGCRLREGAPPALDEVREKAEAWDCLVQQGSGDFGNEKEALQKKRPSAPAFARNGQETVKDAGGSTDEFAKRTQEEIDREAKG